MTTAQYITVRETAQLLGISEKKVMDLVEEKKLLAYKIAGQFLRLKRSEVLTIRNSGIVPKEIIQFPYTPQEKISDFFYFNDFYIAATITIAILLYVIMSF